MEYVPLNEAAVAFLKTLPRDDEYLFPGRLSEHLTDLKYPWDEICRQVKLKRVRLHDLRHTYASYLVSSGVSLEIVGKLLGHTQAATTKRYAHVADEPLRDATNRFGDTFKSASKRQP